VTWDVPSGALVGVAGPSGAGKTMPLRLIAGRLTPTSGSVSRASSQVAWVSQRPYFFQGTIADNLRIADPDAPDDALWRALQDVGMAKAVAAIPGGLSATLNWQGRRLSGGEAQRVAVARALLSDAGPWPSSAMAWRARATASLGSGTAWMPGAVSDSRA
jgi:ABC-type transport system involved in cytochrome bd biosynthesis fused ATPase/permease subunit